MAPAWSVPEMAARTARLATAAPAVGGSRDLGWSPRPTGRAHEPGRGPSLDSLARLSDPGFACGLQCLLFGLSVSPAANDRPPLAAGGTRLAALAVEQVVGGLLARCLPMVL